MPTTSLMPMPKQQYVGVLGTPLIGGKIYTFASGTTTPKATFTDAAATTPHENPITLNSRGEPPTAIFWSGNYRVVIRDARGNLVYTVDNYNTDPAGVWGTAENLASGPGSSLVGFQQAGQLALQRTVQDKARERVSIDDFPTLQAALDAISGSEKTGFGAAPVSLDFLGKTVDFTGTLYWPTNVSPINGGVRSSGGRLVMRNPFLANPGLRGYTEYWPYMTISAKDFHFNCLTILNVYIGAFFSDCDFTGDYGALILVNSNALWTEYNTFLRCKIASNAGVGAGGLMDGNFDGTSIYSTGTGAGTPDGSFGYTKFLACKTDSTSPAVGLKVDFGAVPYNGTFQFDGYARGAGGAAIFINNANMSHAQIDLNLESFGAASNAISLGAKATFGFNSGRIKSASPQMTMSQDPLATVVNNNIGVEGIILQDKNGTLVPSGHSVQSTIRTHLLKRLDYFSGEQYMIDTLVGTTVAATGSLESRVPNTGDINWFPQDPRSSASRNYQAAVNKVDFGDWALQESSTRLTQGSVVRLRVKSGGNLVPGADNAQSFGEAALRWSNIFAGTGAINTSDERHKEEIQDIPEAVLRAWSRVGFNMFKFKDAVERKADGARWHFGVIAQQVKEAFEAEGLDPFVYGLLCYDEWEARDAVLDEEGNEILPARTAGNIYGVRYEEALVLTCALLMSKLSD